MPGIRQRGAFTGSELLDSIDNLAPSLAGLAV